MNIILASGSPRRTEILTIAKIKHQVIPSTCKEVIDPLLKPHQVVESLSLQKALDVFKNHQEDLIIGADTIVSIDNEILGKPIDLLNAKKMLQTLNNRTHQVITGVTIIYKNKIKTFHEITNVTFTNITNKQIEEYITSEEVLDKAGSYAVQGSFCKYIKRIEGEYFNVVGLPIARLNLELEEFLNEI